MSEMFDTMLITLPESFIEKIEECNNVKTQQDYIDSYFQFSYNYCKLFDDGLPYEDWTEEVHDILRDNLKKLIIASMTAKTKSGTTYSVKKLVSTFIMFKEYMLGINSLFFKSPSSECSKIKILSGIYSQIIIDKKFITKLFHLVIDGNKDESSKLRESLKLIIHLATIIPYVESNPYKIIELMHPLFKSFRNEFPDYKIPKKDLEVFNMLSNASMMRISKCNDIFHIRTNKHQKLELKNVPKYDDMYCYSTTSDLMLIFIILFKRFMNFRDFVNISNYNFDIDKMKKIGYTKENNFMKIIDMLLDADLFDINELLKLYITIENNINHSLQDVLFVKEKKSNSILYSPNAIRINKVVNLIYKQYKDHTNSNLSPTEFFDIFVNEYKEFMTELFDHSLKRLLTKSKKNYTDFLRKLIDNILYENYVFRIEDYIADHLNDSFYLELQTKKIEMSLDKYSNGQ